MVSAWLESELCAELRDSEARVHAELPFLLPVGGSIVRGTIDVLADTERGPLVIDYKTDARSPRRRRTSCSIATPCSARSTPSRRRTDPRRR